MVILGIETSCDETSAAVLLKEGNRITILSNVTASSAELQAKYGGIIPEQAAREQLKSIIPVIETAINDSDLVIKEIDAIAVTQGPGLIGSLLIGVETAKTLSYVWNKPLIPVNHLLGHLYANWIDSNSQPQALNNALSFQPPSFPLLGLLVSGGHTDLVYFKDHMDYLYLGGTRDDAAGECFDKCARLIGFSYPGGPAIAQSAMEFKTQNSKFKIELPRPLLNNDTFDFSFSGLKTAVAREVDNLKKLKQWNKNTQKHLSYEIQEAIIEVLVEKTITAAKKYNVKQLIVAGGVAANKRLSDELKIKSDKLGIKLHIPKPVLCTDNGAMIASVAFFLKPIDNLKDLQANPNLSLENENVAGQLR